MDQWDDDIVTTALRRRATAIDVGDVDAASATVRRRAGRRRTARSVSSAAAVLVMATAGVVAIRSLGEDGQVVRTPATAGPSVVATTPVSTSPPTAPPSTSAPSLADSPVTSTVETTVASTTIPAGPDTTAAPIGPTYTSEGGSIRVELVDGGLRLVGQPDPAPGYTVEIEDQRPDRVRVRFDDGERRSRITVDLSDGRPRPEIEEE